MMNPSCSPPPKPAQPIAKGLAGPAWLAQVVLGKFVDHLPGYRLEDIFSRYQVPVRRSTIDDWLSSASELVEPLCELMKQQVLASRIIHTDDTTVKLMDSSVGGTRQARFWAYLGDKGHPYTVYDFTETRKRAGPESSLEGFAGYLQADAYGGYDGIYLGSNGRVQEVSCWAHCRRYWYKARDQDPARSAHSLAVFQRLYNLDHTHRESIATDRHAARVEHALPLLYQWKQWLCEEQFLPTSLIGKAATYTLNQWEGLCRYTENGELSIDNNRSERAMKTVAIGRKAWLFVGSVEAGKRAARLMSLVASCKENEVEPWALPEGHLQTSAIRRGSNRSPTRPLAAGKSQAPLDHRQPKEKGTPAKIQPVDHRALTLFHDCIRDDYSNCFSNSAKRFNRSSSAPISRSAAIACMARDFVSG